MRELSFLSGNFDGGSDGNMHGRALSYPRRLVEECLAVSLADLRRTCGRKILLAAAIDARAVKFQLQGQRFEVYLLAEPQHMTPRARRTPTEDVLRLWLGCLGCRHRVRRLFTFPLAAGSPVLADLRCRGCHGLRYQSQLCCKNRWWKETAMPLKRLLRRRARHLARKQSTKVQAQLEELDRLIWIMQQRAKPKSSARRRLPQRTGMKRPYRDLNPILQALPC